MSSGRICLSPSENASPSPFLMLRFSLSTLFERTGCGKRTFTRIAKLVLQILRLRRFSSMLFSLCASCTASSLSSLTSARYFSEILFSSGISSERRLSATLAIFFSLSGDASMSRFSTSRSFSFFYCFMWVTSAIYCRFPWSWKG